MAHLLQSLEREAVEQGEEAEGEVAHRGRRVEGPLLGPTGDDRGEVIAPWIQQLFEELVYVLVMRRTGPGFQPEDPARVRVAGGQVKLDEPFELAPGAGHLGQGGLSADGVLVLLPGQGL